MTKTDKELTIELVNNYVNSWNNATSTKAMTADVVADIVKLFHETIQTLPESEKKSD